MPVPGMVKETQSDPVGALPMRKPAMPQLTPMPRDVTVVRAPPPKFIDLRQRQPKGMLHQIALMDFGLFCVEKISCLRTVFRRLFGFVNTAGILNKLTSKLAQFEIDPSNPLVSGVTSRYVINPYSLGLWSYRL